VRAAAAARRGRAGRQRPAAPADRGAGAWARQAPGRAALTAGDATPAAAGHRRTARR